MFERFTSPFLLKRLLVELRGIRRALERQADAQEFQARHASGGAFRPAAAQEQRRRAAQQAQQEQAASARSAAAVTYVHDGDLSRMLQVEAELAALLGREPTEAELERSFRGEGL